MIIPASLIDTVRQAASGAGSPNTSAFADALTKAGQEANAKGPGGAHQPHSHHPRPVTDTLKGAGIR